ncbi:MAG: phospholipid carrier-dependent glycosyltransferase, partial [Dehalococcoidales bacterium]
METVKRLLTRFSRWEYAGLLMLVLVTLVLHFSVIMAPDEPLFDEQYYIPDARLIIDGEGTEHPEHPPLGKLFIVAGIELFGDNPLGWRFFSVLLGTTSIIFFYLICRRLTLSKRVSFLATFLIAFETLSFVHAGIALLDVYSLVFALAAFWLYLRGNYAMSGVAIGLSALAKLNGALVLPVIVLHWFLTVGWIEVWQQLRFQLWFLTGREHRLRRFLLRFLWNGWLGAIFLSLAIWGTLALFDLGGSFGQGIIGNDQGLIGILRILGLYVLGV